MLFIAMAGFNTLRIARASFLRSLSPDLLLSFLQPYREYLLSRGFDSGGLDPEAAEGYQALGDILRSPDSDTPGELTEALYIVTMVSQPPHSELLTGDAGELEIAVEEEDCAEAIALKIWLRDPQRLKYRYTESHLTRARSFEYFSAQEELEQPLQLPSPAAFETMRRAFDRWFVAKKRGEGCQISVSHKGTEIWFLICHGELFRRVGAWREGQSESLGYRPDKYDVVVYDQLTNELRIHAATPAQREFYRKQFGFHLFGRENHFPGINKYTLDPLRDEGRLCLVCDDVEGLRSVSLSRIIYVLPDGERLKRTEASEDIFAAHQMRGLAIPAGAKLLSATFSVRFRDNPKPRAVTIKPSNVALYSRDEDSSCIEEWLRRRGFIINGRALGHEQSELFLEII